jgi:hypothetical protein
MKITVFIVFVVIFLTGGEIFKRIWDHFEREESKPLPFNTYFEAYMMSFGVTIILFFMYAVFNFIYNLFI